MSKEKFVVNGDLFGRYAKIAHGYALGGDQDYHIYKIVQHFRSNFYCDVPLTYQTKNNPYNHSEVVDVLNVIHCGIDEDKVIRVAMKDCEILPEPDNVKHGKWLKEKRSLWSVAKCSVCGYISTECLNFCGNCGAKMDLEENNGID
ncbi:MAG: hypothetical protein IJ828_00855 [Treponema sp.]|nr:hypothetical protein [Treponema sp.]